MNEFGRIIIALYLLTQAIIALAGDFAFYQHGFFYIQKVFRTILSSISIL
jgi:hypothetical protein